MNTAPTRCYIVHDRAGRILAMASIPATQGSEGVNLGWRPIPGRNQFVTEIELSAEHAALPLHELLAFKLKTGPGGGAPSLHAQEKPRRASNLRK